MITPSPIPGLAADIGGTNVRLCLTSDGRPGPVHTFATHGHNCLEDLILAFMGEQGIKAADACLAIAAPVSGSEISMTNLAWRFSKDSLRQRCGLRHVCFINDFEAIALGIPSLAAADRHQIGGGQAQPDKPIAVCGPGTGLGVAHLLPTQQGWLTLAGEGGHVDFAPMDEIEAQILSSLRHLHGDHVSVERLLSGPGLESLHRIMATLMAYEVQPMQASQITHAALRGDTFCAKVLRRFCAILGGFAGNLALTMATFGGVYIAGGMAPRFLDFLAASDFRSRFEAKGRYQAYNARIPTYVITHPNPGLLGAALHLHRNSGHTTKDASS